MGASNPSLGSANPSLPMHSLPPSLLLGTESQGPRAEAVPSLSKAVLGAENQGPRAEAAPSHSKAVRAEEAAPQRGSCASRSKNFRHSLRIRTERGWHPRTLKPLDPKLQCIEYLLVRRSQAFTDSTLSAPTTQLGAG